MRCEEVEFSCEFLATQPRKCACRCLWPWVGRQKVCTDVVFVVCHGDGARRVEA